MKAKDIEQWYESSSEFHSALEKLYARDLALLLPKLSPSVARFEQIQNELYKKFYTTLHDAAIRSIVTLDAELKIETSVGTVRLTGVTECHLDIYPESVVWIREEIVLPPKSKTTRRGSFEFNVLLSGGEISCVAQEIEFINEKLTQALDIPAIKGSHRQKASKKRIRVKEQ